VVLSQVRAPGNFGTLVRTSAAIGGAGFILLGSGIDPFEPVVVRASMGALFRHTFVRASLEELRQWLHRYQLLVVGASPDGAVPYDQVRYTRPTVLVLGEERSGLSQDQRALCQHIVHIPMVAGADSLNLGGAGSLLMYAVVTATKPP
jgi:TrmH family RNA methyltransferase